MKSIGSLVVCSVLLYAENMDALLDGFDDAPVEATENVKASNNTQLLDEFDQNDSVVIEKNKTIMIPGVTGKITEQLAYSYLGTKPHDNLTSMKSSLFLDYEHKFENDWRIKTNFKAYYDAIYDLRDGSYSEDELDKRRSDLMLFDAYVQGSLVDKLDMKLGRQVIVWGRSDTIRITDVLNPLDNRRPGMVDIEDLRLPVTMAKFDFFYGDWRFSPMAILEQRFTLNPPFGSDFNPQADPHLPENTPNDVTYAFSLGGEFSGWDINFYAANIHDDAGYLKQSGIPTMEHPKVNMFGTALNVLNGSWLFKMEMAYLDGLHFTSTQEKAFERVDGLIGMEYNGIAETMISYDISLRHLNAYDTQLLSELNPLKQDTYQQALRISSDLMHDTLTLNYLISLYGEKMNEGGFQRAWMKYELDQGINANIGIVDYIGGSALFDAVKNNDMIFADISYSF